MASHLYRILLAILAVLLGSKYATATRTDLCSRGRLYRDIADTSHSTPLAAEFFHNYFTAKSLHDPNLWLQFFNPVQVAYYDATLGVGWSNFSSFQAAIIPLVQSWPDNAPSYPLLILGDTNSAVVHFVDTPGLFGAELRVTAAIDFDENGTVIRQVDYWDGRRNPVINDRPSAAQYPYSLGVNTVTENAGRQIDTISRQLSAAFVSGNSSAAVGLFSYDAIFEDATVRARLEGQLAIGNYLQRALSHLPYGPGARLRRTVGSNEGGGYEWGSDQPLLNGITALELDCNGLITRLMTVWDGSRIADSEIEALVSLTIE